MVASEVMLHFAVAHGGHYFISICTPVCGSWWPLQDLNIFKYSYLSDKLYIIVLN